jgi:uncharacterized protein DUF4136
MRTLSQTLGWSLLISACLMPPLLSGKTEAFTGKNADFARYKTYQWFPPRVVTKLGIEENNPSNPLLKEVIGRQLSQKGLTELADGADLQIQIWVLTEPVPHFEALVATTISIDLGTSAVTVNSDPIASVGRYNRQGTLYVNLIDSRTQKSVWFAMVSDSLPSGILKPEDIRDKLEKAATNIFKKYPGKK